MTHHWLMSSDRGGALLVLSLAQPVVPTGDLPVGRSFCASWVWSNLLFIHGKTDTTAQPSATATGPTWIMTMGRLTCQAGRRTSSACPTPSPRPPRTTPPSAPHCYR